MMRAMHTSHADKQRVKLATQGLEPHARGTLHPASCDACGGLVFGLRFKCLECPDFDLCNGCMDSTNHAHLFCILFAPVVFHPSPSIELLRKTLLLEHEASTPSISSISPCARCGASGLSSSAGNVVLILCTRCGRQACSTCLSGNTSLHHSSSRIRCVQLLGVHSLVAYHPVC